MNAEVIRATKAFRVTTVVHFNHNIEFLFVSKSLFWPGLDSSKLIITKFKM